MICTITFCPEIGISIMPRDHLSALV